MRVIWTRSAKRDRRRILEIIAAHDHSAARRIDELFLAATTSMSDFPQIGRVGAIEGTRELIPHRSYRLVYEIRDEAVFVVALVHTARLWPPETP